MDPEKLAVKFHFNGQFQYDGSELRYSGGDEAVAYIDRDLVSLPELVGHLKDHCTVSDGHLLHWLEPGKEMNDGMHLLLDDKECLDMSRKTEQGSVADIFVENPTVEENEDEEAGSEEEDSDVVAEMLEQAEDDEESKEMHGEDVNLGAGSSTQVSNSPKYRGQEGDDDSSDSEYVSEDSWSSEDDEEAKDILKKFKEFKKKLKSGEVAQLDDVFVEGPNTQIGDLNVAPIFQEEGNASPYADSSYSDESIEDTSSDGGVGKELCSYPRFNKKDAMPNFCLGMKFSGRRQFKKAVIKMALAEKKVIKFIKDEPSRVRAKCDWFTCPWVCLLSKNSTTTSWRISSFVDQHACPPRMDNRLVTARRIAKKYEKMIRANPTWSIQSMQLTVREEMFADVSMSKLKRAKALVMEKLLDATKGQYQRVFDYQLELLRSNPGSTVIVKLDPNERKPIFHRMYICLEACKRGFLAGCRKVVGLDGCFFECATNGELLCAVGRDGNNQMYPIAWAVVERENNDSWDWFCDLLFRDIQVGDGNGWVFISDQQKGILAAVEKWAPNAEHRNCARHIYANWRKQFKNREWQKKFWRCAKAPCPSLFNLARAKLAQSTREGAQAILNAAPEHWSRAWFRLGSNCDSVDNNMCESFTKWIVEARFFPIITMLEIIRRKVMIRIQQNSLKLERWNTRICPNILRKLNGYITESGFCHAICNGADSYEVKHKENRFTVNLVQQTCSCRYWQLSGLPCPHAIACLHLKTNTLDAYIAPCFYVEEFKKTYSHFLEPVEGMQHWPASDRPKPLAPPYVRMRGRPKKEIRREFHEKPKATRISKVGTVKRCAGRPKPLATPYVWMPGRRREFHEKPMVTRLSKVGTVIRCGRCKGVGHNRKTCEAREVTSSAGASVSAQATSVSAGAASFSAAPNATCMVSNTEQSSSTACTVSKKRKRTSSVNQQRSIPSGSTTSTTPKKQYVTRSTAKANVSTVVGGTASLNLHAHVPLSNASSSVTISVTSGSASAKVTAQEATTNNSAFRPPRAVQNLLLRPGGSK